MTQTPTRPVTRQKPAIAGRPNLFNNPYLAREYIRDLIGAVPGWDGVAACATADPEAWFPKKGENPRYAKGICRRCEIRTQCLAGALERGEKFGIWGGESAEQERRKSRS
jgi:WhiB family redox-sensing transcriptional regulator